MLTALDCLQSKSATSVSVHQSNRLRLAHIGPECAARAVHGRVAQVELRWGLESSVTLLSRHPVRNPTGEEALLTHFKPVMLQAKAEARGGDGRHDVGIQGQACGAGGGGAPEGAGAGPSGKAGCPSGQGKHTFLRLVVFTSTNTEPWLMHQVDL